MVVIVIVGAVAAFAIPAVDALLKNNRRTVVVNELLSHLILARAEAARSGQSVSICAAISGADCGGGTNWDYGWTVFLDPAGTGAVPTAASVLRRYVSVYGGDLKVRADTAGATTGHIVMRPFNQGGTQASLLICDKRGAREARVVCVESNGRPSVSDKACDTGAALTCP
jgi:type IV fimbrial biogenesis protein FimT